MNYFEKHIGDYIKNTAHLSMVEDGAYNRLIDAYYTREGALPASVKDCCKLARASSKLERDAVAYVLSEFFELRDDGHHQVRCDEEIARYLESEPEREAKRINERDRQRRARERRRELFDQLRSHDIVPPWDTKTSELETLLSCVTNNVQSRTSHAPVTRDNTATSPQSPDTSPQDINPIASAGVNPPKGEEHMPDSLGKFPMRTDWQPNPETLAAVCIRSGCLPSIVTQPAIADFVGYWSSEQKVFTEAQWAQKLIDSAKRYALKNPETNHAATAGKSSSQSFADRQRDQAREAIAELDGANPTPDGSRVYENG